MSFLLFLRLRAAFSISMRESLFACQSADFLPPFRGAQLCILFTRTCIVPRSGKHLGVLLLRFDAVYTFYFYLLFNKNNADAAEITLRLEMKNDEKCEGYRKGYSELNWEKRDSR